MASVLRRTIVSIVMGVAAITTSIAPSSSQDGWPNRTIRIVVPFAPGGSSDALARLVANKISQPLGQSVVVENRPGAGGLVGAEYVSKSAPDGYTLGVSGFSSHVVAPAMSSASFDPIKGFSHIALMGGAPDLLIVHPNVTANNVKEFIALANASKTGFAIASPGVGTTNHLHLELFRVQSKANIVHVPYRGSGPAMSDLMGRHVLGIFTTLVSADQMIREKMVRPLAISTARRLTRLPDVPTFPEEGYPDIVGTAWFGISGPPGMSPAIIKRLNEEIRLAVKDRSIAKWMEDQAVVTEDFDAGQFTRFIEAEIRQWGETAKGIR